MSTHLTITDWVLSRCDAAAYNKHSSISSAWCYPSSEHFPRMALSCLKSVWLVIGFGNLGLYCVHFCLRRWDANTNFSKLVTSQTLFSHVIGSLNLIASDTRSLDSSISDPKCSRRKGIDERASEMQNAIGCDSRKLRRACCCLTISPFRLVQGQFWLSRTAN